MIRLHPQPDVHFDCPHGHGRLVVTGWWMPGMRALAKLRCSVCCAEYFGDLSVGQGLYTPMLLDAASGDVEDAFGCDWYAAWLRRGYLERERAPARRLQVQSTRPLRRRALLLNCLDAVYGHSLLKLLNAQAHLEERPDLDLVVLVPQPLAWLVPDGVAQTWTVDTPFAAGAEWNNGLARELAELVGGLDECWLSVAFSHPHPDDVSIERFSRVRPFDRSHWSSTPPTVTFVWRDDRTWRPMKNATRAQHHLKRIAGRLGAADARRQSRLFKQLVQELRRTDSSVRLQVAGLRDATAVPSGVDDLRVVRPDATTERTWCEAYARSHVVVGVHGSNMLLPSAHAGSVLEVVPDDRHTNVVQDVLPTSQDPREAMFTFRTMSASATPSEIAAAVMGLLRGYANHRLTMSRETTRHSAAGDAWVRPNPWQVRRQAARSAERDTAAR